MFKSPTQPLCRYCGKAIAKHTHQYLCRLEKSQYDSPSEYTTYVYGEFLTKDDCQRAVNTQVVSISRSQDKKRVLGFTTWDGESYRDEFFCNGDHAKRYAYALARQTRYSMDGFWKALSKQVAKIKEKSDV